MEQRYYNTFFKNNQALNIEHKTSSFRAKDVDNKLKQVYYKNVYYTGIIICCNPQADSVIYAAEILRRIIVRKPAQKDFGIATAEMERGNMGQKIKQDDVIMIGKNIRDIRVEKRITQEEVAERLLVYGIKISRGTYSKIEMGIRNIEASSLEAIKNILDTTYERLFEHT